MQQNLQKSIEIGPAECAERLNNNNNNNDDDDDDDDHDHDHDNPPTPSGVSGV